MMRKFAWKRKFNAVFWTLITGLLLYGIFSYIFVSLGYIVHMVIMVINLTFWLVIFTLAVFATLWLTIKLKKKKNDPAIQILKERFARGEISQKEFKHKAILVRKNWS